MNVIKINDINDKRLDIFYRKKEEQLQRAGIFIGESELIIERALNQGYEVESFLIREKDNERFKEFFTRVNYDYIIYEVSEDIFKQLKGYLLTRDILVCFKRKSEININEIIMNTKRIAVLERVTNPTNIGAIFRNAVGLNFEGVLLTKDCADPLSRRSLRTSMGNVFGIKWTYVQENYLEQLRNQGFKTVALALNDHSVNIDDIRLKEIKKLAVILGNEGYGLDEQTIKASDYVAKIQMNPLVDSLNVASASGIAFWELGKHD